MFEIINRPGRALALGATFVFSFSFQASADQLGADLQQLLDVMERSHPMLTAATAARDAAAAEVDIAGALEDPHFQASFEDIDREDGGPFPQRVGSIFYSIEQTFPLGGKRTLRQQVAKAGVVEAETERDQALLDLIAEMKTAFAQHYLAIATAEVVEEEGAALRQLAQLARERYSQGLGRQQEAIEAEAELSTLDGARGDAERDRMIAVERINALIGRSLEAPLAPPAGLPPIPDVQRLDLEVLIVKAESRSPTLAASAAAIDGATSFSELTDRNWYPDITLGVSIVDRDRNISGYEAKIGFNIPLQWGLRRAEQSEAKAKLATARARFTAARIDLSIQISQSLRSLLAASIREEEMRTRQIPRLEEAVEAARRAYAADQAELADALGAVLRLKQAEIEHLRVLFERQTLIAELERLVGGSL